MSGGELKSFDRVADVYDATRAMPADVSKAVADAISALAHEVSAEPRLIEVGIGTGRIAVPLAERGVRVTGIDISTAMLSVLLGKRRDIDVMLAEASQPPFRPATFDASLFVHILHLVPDPEATVRATLALVRPGGIAMAGGDDHRNSIRDSADGIIQSTVRELSGVEMGGWQPYAHGQQTFERVARELGAAVETRAGRGVEQLDDGAQDARAAGSARLLVGLEDPGSDHAGVARARAPAARGAVRRLRDAGELRAVVQHDGREAARLRRGRVDRPG